MTANATDFGSAALGAFLRAVGLVGLAIGATLALIFAFFAAMVVALMIAGAALAMKVWPAKRRTADRSQPGVLEAHRTPTGWVVETTTRKS